MAYHDSDNQPKNTQNTQAAGAGEAGGTASAFLGSISSFGGMQRLAIIADSGSEVLNKAHEVLAEAAKSVTAEFPEEWVVEVLKLDREIDKKLSHSLLVFTLRNQKQPSAGVSYHGIIVEASAPKRDPYYQNINGINTEITPTISDVVQASMIEQVSAHVAQRTGERFPVHYAEFSQMVRDFDLEGKEEVRRMAANALMACRNVLAAGSREWTDMIAVRDVENPGNLIARVTFNPHGEQPTDDIALPMRTDVSVDLMSIVQNGQGGYGDQRDRSEIVNRIGGFVDLLWSPQQQPQPQYGFGYMGQPQRMPPYAGRFIITSFDSPQERSVGSQLFALATATMLYSENIAMASLLPHGRRSDRSDRIPHDIGYLNVENGVVIKPDEQKPSPVKLDGDTMTPEAVTAYVNAQIQPNFEIAMDISLCGADTWVRSPFFATALQKGEQAERAYQTILDAANQLTNNEFSKRWKPGTPFMYYRHMLPLGYYVDSNGQKRDLRDIDYLAVLAVLGTTNNFAVRDWSEAQHNPNLDYLVSVARQRNIIQQIVENPVYTGLGARVVVNPVLQQVLTESLRASGVEIRVNTPNMGSVQQRYIPQVQQVNPAQILGGMGAYNYGSGYGQGYGPGAGFVPNTFGR